MRKIQKNKDIDFITKEDISSWENFKKQDNISFEDKDLNVHQPSKKFKFDLKYDLHGYSLQEAFDKVDEIFDLSKKKVLLVF